MLRLSAPFGEALLDIRTASGAATASAPSREYPALPAGMRVDDFRLHTASMNCEVGGVLSVTLRLELKNGWRPEYASGESFDAFEVTTVDGHVVVVGMRDPEWLCSRFGLEIIDANKPDAEANLLIARYQVLKAGSVDIQAALAWTNQPTTDRERDSPWFAVDLAMKF